MKSERQIKKARKDLRGFAESELATVLARKRCPLWRRMIGIFIPNIPLRWEIAWKVKNMKAIRVAMKKTSRVIAVER